MTTQELIQTASTLPEGDLLTLQAGIADIVTSRFSPDTVQGIAQALDEVDTDFARDRAFSPIEARRELGL